MRTGVFQSRETLVIPTSWRDSYPPSRDGSESEEQRFTRMLDDVNRQWKAAREVGAPLVLLIHPVHAVSRRGMHRNVMPRLKQAVVDQARAQDIPIMTFSEYHRRIEARR